MGLQTKNSEGLVVCSETMILFRQPHSSTASDPHCNYSLQAVQVQGTVVVQMV